MIFKSLIELIGNTPMVEAPVPGAAARVLLKIESFNPGGSAKDRVALRMIDDAERSGQLKPGAVIIEPTSGNTGVGLAWVGRLKGYRTILVMPDSMSLERRKLLQAYGAELVLTPGSEGMSASIAEAQRLRDEISGSFIPGQFDNPSNSASHEDGTAQEIWNDCGGKVDVYVAAMGTGGTLCGTARGLKKHNPSIHTVCVEPAESPLLTKGVAGCHRIQGIGADFIPANYDASVVDEVMDVSGDEAVEGARELVKYGILTGYSGGAAYSAARQLSMRGEYKGKTIVVVLPDTGERYLSTDLYDE